MDFVVLHKIISAQSAYIRCIDQNKLEEWPDHFHEPCLYKVTTAENERDELEAGVIFANTKGMLQDRVSALRDANIYERQSYRHVLGQPFIVSINDAEVRCETPFIVARIVLDGETSLFATGIYKDRFLVDSDVAKLIERIVVCDSSRLDTLLALPL